MPKALKPTRKQKAVFKDMVLSTAKGENLDMKTLMMRNGYKESTALAPSLNLTSKPQWQQLLNEIDEAPLMAKLNSIALDDDKRSAIAAIIELMKLKDRYPANKMKVSQYQEELNQF